MKAGHSQVATPAASPAIAVPVSFAACHAAWLKARRGKRPSANQLAFEVRWVDRLLELKTALRAGRWQPARTVSFIVSHPKTREIHAPDFADRVVHHLLVERLEKLYEPVFIHDSYANRKSKGSHAAVDRLQQFMRSRNGQGWYLQLDIHNYFNSINRHILYQMLCHRLQQCERRAELPAAHLLALRSLCHKLLANKVTETVRDPAAAARLPPHKRLANAAPGCGLPVGNLTSQFFANVYLNALDQFAKHSLKCKHYVRYVDDFVLLADDAEQLRLWQAQIDEFLANTLGLKCKEAVILQPLCQGIDFLGYRVFAEHRRVRPRVVAHCRAKLQAWAAHHVQMGGESGRVGTILCPRGFKQRGQTKPTFAHPTRESNPEQDALAHLQAMLGSYWGHFAHAQSVRLRHALFEQFAWLKSLFVLHPDGQLSPRWVLQGVTFACQAAALQAGWPQAQCLIQKGKRWLLLSQPEHELNPDCRAIDFHNNRAASCAPTVARLEVSQTRFRRSNEKSKWANGLLEFNEQATHRLTASLRRQGIAYVCANQTGWLRHGTRRREVQEWFSPNAVVS